MSRGGSREGVQTLLCRSPAAHLRCCVPARLLAAVLQRSAAADYESSFEGCYELFGGTGCTEELEHLSSECAHVCNK